MKENEGLFLPDGSFISRQEIIKKVGIIFEADSQGKPVDLHAALLDILDYKTATKPEEMADKLKIGMDLVTGIINDLKNDGYGIRQDENGYTKTKNVDPKANESDDSWLGKDFKVGVISDTHQASRFEKTDELEKMYDIMQKEGISVVYHAGDISDGFGVYRGQEYEVKVPGQDEQIDYVVANYPKRQGMVTKFIGGNHDMRMYEKGGVDPGKPITKRRPDLVYLGPTNAIVNWYDGVTLELLHPSGGIAYSLSYKAQRHINSRSPNNLPDALVFGHYHTAFYMHYRGIDFLQAGCFKDEGLWEKALGLNPTIGGWIVEGKINDGRIVKFKPELYTFEKKPK